MKVSTMPAAPVQTPNSNNLMKIKMTTNATPLSIQQVQQPQTPVPPQPQLSTPDINDKTPAQADAATQTLSPQMALIAKQRKALLAKEREIQAREKALQSMAQKPEGAIDLARLKADPLSVLLESGVTYDQLTKAIMESNSNKELLELKQKMDLLEQGIEKKFVERDTQAEKQILTEMTREAHQLSQRDEFELVRETKNIPTVISLIERTYKETGEVLDVFEALKLVEEELYNDAQKVLKLKKLQQQQQAPQQRVGMRTLTNRDTASVPLSAKARAIAAFHGTLKR